MNTDPEEKQKKSKKKKKEYTYERPHRITQAERFVFAVDECIIAGLFWYGVYKLIIWLIHAF
jgi:hypothetical protein